MASFDPIHTPIDPGLTLLEAGAGTGKTYSLVRLVARQIVEQDILIEQILIVTFTKAATAEIHQRLQNLLRQLYNELHTPEQYTKKLDLSMEWLSRDPESIQKIQKHLRRALRSFDKAPIFTIDSFFYKLTREYSLDIGELSSAPIELNSESFIEDALKDYWRQYVYPMSAEQYANFSLSFQQANSFLQRRFKTPNAELDPAYYASEEDYQAAWTRFTNLLLEHHTALFSFLTEPPSCFSKQKRPFNVSKKKILSYLTEIIENPSFIHIQLEQLQSLSSPHLSDPSLLKKNQHFQLENHPLFPLFQAIDSLLTIPESWRECIQIGEIERYVKQRLPQIKSTRHVQCHSDITERLHALLQTEQGDPLRYTCRANYKAVSIDEFQDTSPYQCDIFLRLFHHLGGSLHIIGDPKQSIYRFRGADVYAYLNARKLANQHYELLTNYRSPKPLVEGINLLFQQIEDPFYSQGAIKFQAAGSAHTLDAVTPPVEVRHVEGNAPQDVTHDLAEQIHTLLRSPWSELYSNHAHAKEHISASDICVLVRSAHQANMVFEVLSKVGIPCAIRTNTNLFQTREAKEFRILLHALLEPQNLSAIQLALLTPALGYGSQMTEKPDTHLEWIEQFRKAHDIWQKKGLLSTIYELDGTFNLRKHLLELHGGERKATNYFHLAELLDQKARTDSLTPVAINYWLESALQNDIDDLEAETDQLRIASDRQAVQIQTIHTSKGLEYPIVFIPFTYASLKSDNLTYHQDGKTHIAPYKDKVKTKAQRQLEEQADAARLLYVALTRAQHRCVLYVDLLAEKSRRNVTFHEILGKPTLDTWSDIERKSNKSIQFTSRHPEQIQFDLAYAAPKDSATKHPFQCAPAFTPSRTNRHRTTSFSGLTRQLADIRDHDPYEPTTMSKDLEHESPYQEQDFWSHFQPGAALGLVFHEFFEEADFQNREKHLDLLSAKFNKYKPYLPRSVASQSQALQFQKAMIAQVNDWIPTVLNQQLHPELSLKLADISHAQRLNEARFLFTSKDLSISQFARILEQSPPPYLPNTYIERIKTIPQKHFEGFLDGIIDLIFEHDGKYHLLDWKTNKIKDNQPSALAETMAHHHYFFQYHLYALALDALLSQRLKDYDPEKHLGHVFYVFFRGISDGEPASGIYSDKLSGSRLENLKTQFRKNIFE